MRRFVEAFQDQYRLDHADEIFDPESRRSCEPQPARGGRAVEGFKWFYGGMLQGFPDLRVRVHAPDREADMVVTRKIFQGTHNGNGPSAAYYCGIRRLTILSNSSDSIRSGYPLVADVTEYVHALRPHLPVLVTEYVLCSFGAFKLAGSQ